MLLAAILVSACGGGNKLHFTREGVEPSPVPDVPRQEFPRSRLAPGPWRAHSDRARAGCVPPHDGDQVIVAGPGGEVAAIELATGATRWEVDLDIPLTGGVGIGDGLALVGSLTGSVVALNRDDGAEVWRESVGGEVLAPPAVAPGVAVVRAGDGRIVGLDTATGAVSWTVSKAIDGLTVRGMSKVLINGRGAVVGLADGRLVAIDIDRGRTLWETPIGTRRGASEVGRLADIDADPELLGTVLYVASYQSRLVAMALGTPRVIWSADVSTLKNFGIDADRLYVTSQRGTIVALNRFTGEVVWEQDQLSGRGLTGPLAVAGQLLVGDFEGNIFQLDLGQRRHSRLPAALGRRHRRTLRSRRRRHPRHVGKRARPRPVAPLVQSASRGETPNP
ncbi:MAG: outer membrane protein assembly factor BamB [Gammaproteobacteria bacterium]|nr:outer membrane protein assembly factor BamB [Gammaproteobacteria bacterium]